MIWDIRNDWAYWGLALLIVLTMKKGSTYLIAGPVSALFVALMSGMPLFSSSLPLKGKQTLSRAI